MATSSSAVHAKAGRGGGGRSGSLAGGGGNGGASADDPSCVFRAVVAGSTAEQVRQVLEAYAQGSEERRLKAVEFKSSGVSGRTPLEAAHRRRRGDLVGVLLENGADVKIIGPKCSAMALAIHYGLPQTLRVLLCDKREDANAPLSYSSQFATVQGSPADRPCCSAVHLCVAPPLQDVFAPVPPPQLECLDVLVREFGADVNAPDDQRRLPLHWVARAAPGHRAQAAAALVALGADLRRWGPALRARDAGLVRALINLGASANERRGDGFTPLMMACTYFDEDTVAVLLPLSSTETRRATTRGGQSALDLLLEATPPPYDPWKQQAIADLLAAGVPVRPQNAAQVLLIAARLGVSLEARAAALPPWWQRHEAMVNLAFDIKDLRAAEEGVRARERRVHELEDELRALGVGTEDTDEDEGEEDGGGGDVAALAAQLAKV